MNSIQPNDIKKGDLGYLKNGWKFEMMDNKKGNIRMAKVHGIETEIGSIYAHEIAFIQKDGDDVLTVSKFFISVLIPVTSDRITALMQIR